MKNKIQSVTVLIILVLFMVFSTTNTKAQGWIFIDSLKIIPANPTTTSTVQVSCFATFGYSSCFMIDSSVSITDTLITVQAYHMMGMLAAICNSADTLILGNNFSPGHYTILYNLNDSGVVALDTDTLCFTIPVIESITEPGNQSHFNIFPNPASNELTVQLLNAETATNLIITDVFGREIYSQPTNSQLSIINCQLFSSGIYFVKVQLANGDVEVRRFVKE